MEPGSPQEVPSVSIGPTEIVIVLILALLVFGPGRLPQMGRSLGRGLREFKHAADTAKTELGLDEIIDDVNEVKADVTSSLGVDDIKSSIGDLTSTIDDAKKSMGAEEIAAGVGTVKAAMTFDPRAAAKAVVTSRPSPDPGSKAGEEAEGPSGTRESAAPAPVAVAPAAEA
jgi:TatA/E family protein of Tat protein translocase